MWPWSPSPIKDVSSDRLHCSSLLLTLRAKKKKKKKLWSIHQTSLSDRQMAGLCWISVLLAVSLSIGDSEPSMDLDYVTRIAERIETNYLIPNRHFSVAVNIPEDPKNLEELRKVFYNIYLPDVKKVLNQGQVYIGSNAVVAVPQKKVSQNGKTYTDHAEAQVLDNLDNLYNTRQGNILVLYSWLSPCGEKCTNINNRNNILKKILKNVLNKWKSNAFVFHTVFTGPRGGKQATEADIKWTLRKLRQVIVDDNIFRCYNPNNTGFRCVKCFVDASKTADPVAACVRNGTFTPNTEKTTEELERISDISFSTKKMAGLCWMAVMLSVLLSAVDRADAVDLETLASYVSQIKTMYGTQGMFSLAVSIPLLENTNSLQQVLKGSDPVKNVKDALNKDEVYVGRRVVAAKLLNQLDKSVQHAESRVVDHLDALFKKQEENNQDMLLFYVYASPCDQHCLQTEPPGSILNRINKIRQWQSYAVVFSEVFKPRNQNDPVPYDKLRAALRLLGNHQGPRGQIGLDHVFRCKKPERSDPMECTRCGNGNQVAHKCISNEAEPAPRQSQPSSQLKKPPQAQGSSSSQRVDSDGWQVAGRGKHGKNKGR
ncbi:hypothetical protein F7725_006046 [Dissostichus mawsoni]|uniref:Uncharacterized protein n=1 Tax=Dissostichus mawsoni TaxID=36200 RepID=A0A7J5YV32_DISMA|nr:hypothetical protein F7725_006046 [Dissostichus mawsoni]